MLFGIDSPEKRHSGGTADDSDLVRRAVRHAMTGDAEGLHFLYLRYAPDVLRYVDSLVDEHGEAEAITENVFAGLAAEIAAYEPREMPFVAWILRSAHDAVAEHVPARRSMPATELPAASDCRAQLGLDLSQKLRRALEALPDDQREVLVLRHVVGLSEAEVAATLEKTEGAIHSLHRRGRNTLEASLAAT